MKKLQKILSKTSGYTPIFYLYVYVFTCQGFCFSAKHL